MDDFCVMILTIGIPGSGKSSWVKDYCEKHKNGTFVISTDEIRKELTGNEQCIDPSQNSMIHDEAKKRAKKIIDNRREIMKKLGTWPVIIIDSTNVELKEWIDYRQLGANILAAKLFEVTPEQAQERMKNRERQVPYEIIKWKWDLLEKNKQHISKLFNMLIYF